MVCSLLLLWVEITVSVVMHICFHSERARFKVRVDDTESLVFAVLQLQMFQTHSLTPRLLLSNLLSNLP